MNGSNLRQLVIDELDFQPMIDATSIGVAVSAGVVTLTGHVGSYNEKLIAEQTVQRIKGVRGLAQEIEVRFPDDRKTADDEIARRALKIIDWDTSIPKDSAQVKVQHGWVTLSGTVDWDFQRRDVENAVRRLSGITGVTNLVKIKDRVQCANVKQSIEAALKRDAQIETGQIGVEVTKGEVVLRGHVHSLHERAAVERAAWSVAGVTGVSDLLTIA